MSTQNIVQNADDFTEFVLWIIDQLRYERTVEAGRYRVQIPEADQPAFNGQAEMVFRVVPRRAVSEATAGSAKVEPAGLEQVEILSPSSPRLVALLDQLHALRHVVCSQPRAQLTRLHQIAERLFPAYSVLDGHIHLAGCALEDRPLTRLTYQNPASEKPEQQKPELETPEGQQSQPTSPLLHLYFDAEGNPLSAERVTGLGLTELVPAEESAPQLTETEFDRLILLARKHGPRSATNGEPPSSSPAQQREEPLAETIIWCKYAVGKLAVSIGEQSAEFPFAGWANLIQPEPLNCPQTGEPTYAFAATWEGKIAAASQIARCAETGRRELKRDLIACSVSGKLALPECVVSCPVCEEPVLRSVLIECPVCHQQVSPDVLTHGICRACAEPPRVPKSDARLARLLGEYPRLDQWTRWKLSETATVYIAQASSLLKRLLLVLDKQTLEVRHLATGGSLSRKWQPVPPEQWEDFLLSSSKEA